MAELKDVTLGATYRDRVSGFTGIATSKTWWLNNCLRVGLQGKVNKDNAEAKSYAYDVEDLVYIDNGLLDKSAVVIGAPDAKPAKRRGTGGGGRNDHIGDRL